MSSQKPNTYSQETIDCYYAFLEQVSQAKKTLALSNFRGERFYAVTATSDGLMAYTIQADLLASIPLGLQLNCSFFVKEGCPVSLRLLDSIWEFDPATSKWTEVS